MGVTAIKHHFTLPPSEKSEGEGEGEGEEKVGCGLCCAWGVGAERAVE